jgi:NTP pyrophosphatase (non-canonical NTP hydrolase)
MLAASILPQLFQKEVRLVTIAEAQQRVDAWIRDVGVRYFSELTNLAQLVEEVGEVARFISREYGEQSFKEGERDLDLSEELADVLFVVLCLANQTGVNLTEAFERTLHKKTSRDRERHQQNRKLTDDASTTN